MSQSSFNRELVRLFGIAMEDCFYSSAETEIHTADANSSIHGEFKEFVLLTISSPLFRVLTVIHLNNDDATKAFVANKLNTTADTLTDERFYDFVGEVGNTFCGAIKRSLNNFIPSLGMSTPNRLESGSMKYMLSQKPSFESFKHIEINGQTLFECGIYVCNDTELDFDITSTTTSTTEVEEADCGELEFF
ncbi:hypothetical protein A3742_07485 [Oleiphilus sp. HI0071]|nr:MULTISPECIES: hypothetical protein [unclassified Oleiphilus]KZY62936.1 hypothetical protein A3737_03760 [Oleiphilus sp. HI0065]KZY83213.1 hypothetical protein A3742_07485 [Oleiphilus sp. HI0071]KZY88847.1 hypothetical protein A3744_23920 [Oleiphilus sp. HI0073]KZZ40798.1 hypothetical protein A3758_08780 [Oleiphilus sp. HI0118]KZZ49550.1 hypothetical protein A3760_02435 [Oleiphilus sp. HI0122]KZZ65048.1 hypothetical protein A3765_20570 [Oleiphilus sp. HI0130]KZZ77790.1 hypothetical protein